MKIEFIEPALIELDDAIEYYNIQSPGLGKRLLEEVLSTTRYISRYPSAWPKFTEHTFKITLRKFPYSLIFTKSKNVVYILAVAHHNRKPEYWIKRLNTD
jgi:hypothetical protein